MEEIIEAISSMDRCPFCGSILKRKYNTNPRRLITLNGEYMILERVSRCSNSECVGYEKSFRAEQLQAIIFPRKSFSMDVIMYIGTLRYEEHKTYAEIKEALSKKSIKISSGELTNLTMTFESLIKGWHEEHIQEIREKLGEYILSIDGTYTYKGKTLYIFRSYENGVVLYANTTEKDDVQHVQPLLEKVVEMYGLPIAVISDMQPAIIEAVKNVMPGIPHQFCQYHFTKNAGNFMEKEYKELGNAMKTKEVIAKAKQVEANQKKNDKIGSDKLLLIIHLLVLILKITTDSFPFELYHIETYDRYRRVRRTIRRCISVYPYKDAYRTALCELDAILTTVIADKRVRSLVKSLKSDWQIFKRLRRILENDDKNSKDVVEGRMRRFFSFLERKATTSKKYAPLVKQIKKFWGGLFHAYDYDCIPRTNNDMERFIWELRKKWKRMTCCTRIDEWIAYRAPIGIYMFNLIGSSPPLKELGFSVDLAEMLSSVSYDSYRRCMREYEGQKEDDRIRRRANHDVESVLEEIERMNRAVSSESEV